MKHAFLIMAHHEPKVLELLLTLLDDARNDIYLHIDRRAKSLYAQFEGWQPQSAGFFLLKEREAPAWGHISIVRAELKLFSAAYQHPTPYAYYHLLSGMDLPLKSQDEIHAFFAAHQGKEFVHCDASEEARRVAEKRTDRHYLFLRSLCKRTAPVPHFFTTPIRKTVLGVEKIVHYHRFSADRTFYYGAQWASITDGFCGFLVQHADEIKRLFRFSLCPDELYKQTMLMSSPFAANLYSAGCSDESTQRFIDWTRGHHGHPHTFEAADFDLLKASPYLFARKFSAKHPQLLNMWRAHLASPSQDRP